MPDLRTAPVNTHSNRRPWARRRGADEPRSDADELDRAPAQLLVVTWTQGNALKAPDLLLKFNPAGFTSVLKWAVSLQEVTLFIWDPDRALGRCSFKCPECKTPVRLDGWTPEARVLKGISHRMYLYSRRGVCSGA